MWAASIGMWAVATRYKEMSPWKDEPLWQMNPSKL